MIHLKFLLNLPGANELFILMLEVEQSRVNATLADDLAP